MSTVRRRVRGNPGRPDTIGRTSSPLSRRLRRAVADRRAEQVDQQPVVDELGHSLASSGSPNPSLAASQSWSETDPRSSRRRLSTPPGTSSTASPMSRYPTLPPSSSPQRRRVAAGRLICPRPDTRRSPAFDMPSAYKAASSNALWAAAPIALTARVAGMTDAIAPASEVETRMPPVDGERSA